ncbi:MAG: arginase family protein [Nanoarchaeota archaeon]|nr:arginase family protein [Nanoarchaeota archaeon]MBU4124039.1 arginase family protein [Nanoarchaeota archaeon]
MDFTLIGLPYDETQTFRKGASKAPDMIRSIFPKLETFVNGVDLTEHFIEDLGNLTKEQLSTANITKFPIFIGGEHTVTEWAVDKLKPKNVVIFDAHPDCEDSGKHDGVTKRLAGKGYNTYIIAYGLRTISKKEQEYLNSGKVKVIDASELATLKGDTFVSFDLDILDPAVLPAVGNPEPSGLSFGELIAIFNMLENANIVGVDFVEYTPTEKDNDIYLSIAGKLIYSIMSEIIRKKENKIA